MRSVLILLSLAAGPVYAGDLSPEKVALIRHEEAAALKRLEQEFQTKPGMRSQADRRALIAAQAAASAAVLSQHKLSAKELARYTARMNRAQKAQADQAQKRLQQLQQTTPEAPEVEVHRGFDENNPVQLEEREGAPPLVEEGIPVD